MESSNSFSFLVAGKKKVGYLFITCLFKNVDNYFLLFVDFSVVLLIFLNYSGLDKTQLGIYSCIRLDNTLIGY